MVGEVATLSHKVLDDSVVATSLESVFHLVVTSAEGSEIFSSLWNIVCEQFELEVTKGCTILAYGKEDLRVLRVRLSVSASGCETESIKGHQGYLFFQDLILAGE